MVRKHFEKQQVNHKNLTDKDRGWVMLNKYFSGEIDLKNSYTIARCIEQKRQ
jgi:hypothetical protein